MLVRKPRYDVALLAVTLAACGGKFAPDGSPGSLGGIGDGDAGSGDGALGGDGGARAPLKFADIGPPTRVSGDFYFTEGPVWDPTNDILYFTDINAHQGDTVGGAVYALTLPSTVTLLFAPDGNADGLALDPQGNLVGAGYGARALWRRVGTTVAALSPCASGGGSCYRGEELNTPDDVTARSDGVLYFTDPTFGASLASGPLSLANAQGVYRLTTDGVLHLEDATTNGPNGVNLSPDEATLYVTYTSINAIVKFAVTADGSLSQKVDFASAVTPDSMCVDAAGDVYVGTLSGLEVFGPEGGASLGTIAVGGDVVTNCAFGGPDQRTLFITSHSAATLLGTPTLGSASLYAIAKMPIAGLRGRN